MERGNPTFWQRVTIRKEWENEDGGRDREDDTSGKCFSFLVDTNPQVPPLFVTLPRSAESKSSFKFNPSSLFHSRDLVIERKLTSRCGGGGGGSAKLAVSVSISVTSIFRVGGG